MKGQTAEYGRINCENIGKYRNYRKISEVWITKLDFDNACLQIKLDKRTKNLITYTVTGRKLTGYNCLLKRFCGLADLPTTAIMTTKA